MRDVVSTSRMNCYTPPTTSFNIALFPYMKKGASRYKGLFSARLLSGYLCPIRERSLELDEDI
jgi:hypothetical protein